jgi:hypothetical protein
MTAGPYNGAAGRRDPGMFRRMWAMIVKEFVQMRRDRMTFATMLFVPVLQLTLFGFAINTDPKHLPTAVLVRDEGPLTRAVLQAMKHTDYFEFREQVRSSRTSPGWSARAKCNSPSRSQQGSSAMCGAATGLPFSSLPMPPIP